MNLWIVTLSLACVAHARTAAPSPLGFITRMNDGSQIEVAVAGVRSFRVSFNSNGSPQQIASPLVAPQARNAPFTVKDDGATVSLVTSFGIAHLRPDGWFSLADAQDKAIFTTSRLAIWSGAPPNSTCTNPRVDTDVSNAQRSPNYPNGAAGLTQADCCKTCDNDRSCTVWVWALPGHESEGKNCWLLSSVGGTNSAPFRVTGGTSGGAGISFSLGSSASAKLYGSGANAGNARTLVRTSAIAHVANTDVATPHYYSSDGYSAQAVGPVDFLPNAPSQSGVSWSQSGSQVTWTVSGATHADLYLIPSKTQVEGLDGYWDLTGRPAIPPKYAFGFIACRWGWTDERYISDTLTAFRTGKYPLDAWISDFEWYTAAPDYTVPDQGIPNFNDFGYNGVTFPRPQEQLKTYHDVLHLKFGGIRKPRLGDTNNINMARANGWISPYGGDGGKRQLNFSLPAVRDYYRINHRHFLQDGVDFWWNDEGEISYLNYHWWTTTQAEGLREFSPNKRFWSISRSFTPGMQRLASVVWTGDVQTSWESLQAQPGYFLNWELAGIGFVTCDIGGFSGGAPTALLLVRWYQMAVFMPIMRVHSRIDTPPHFPFLWGAEAGDAMRKALNLRYQLVTHHYSLAHLMYTNGWPMMRPLLIDPVFGSDANANTLTNEWLDGDSILVAPVMQQNNATSVYLPRGTWYQWGTSRTTMGPTTLNLQNVAVDFIPAYVKMGGVVVLNNVIQYVDELPAGPLSVQVYPGADGSFVMVEDDGDTLAYQSASSSAQRRTTFTWSDTARTLSWRVDGTFADSHTFVDVKATVFFATPRESTVQKLNTQGTISF